MDFLFNILGFLGGLHQLFIVSGILYSYMFGNILTYTQLNMVCGVWMVVHLMAMLYVPESPYFLIWDDKKVSAEEALARLRDPGHDCKSELEEIQVKCSTMILVIRISRSDLWTLIHSAW